MPDAWLRPDWPAPPNVHARVSTRRGGVSKGPYASFNLAEHVGDRPAVVEANRRLLSQVIGGCGCQWMRQVHGTRVHQADGPEPLPAPEADALYTRRAGLACAVLTADCLPVLFCDGAGLELAVAHAGWRGLRGGILENTLARFKAPPARLLAWLGPAIGPCHFEVGGEVRRAFLAAGGGALQEKLEAAFRPARAEGKWMADLYAIARVRLQAAGLDAGRIHGGGHCTYCESGNFYSYRRQAVTGRFATLIYRS